MSAVAVALTVLTGLGQDVHHVCKACSELLAPGLAAILNAYYGTVVEPPVVAPAPPAPDPREVKRGLVAESLRNVAFILAGTGDATHAHLSQAQCLIRELRATLKMSDDLPDEMGL